MVSDTKYLHKTPGGCKGTQECHINMLKALVTLNNKLGLENALHSKGCAEPKAEKEEDTESEVRLGNVQQPIKLQNSHSFLQHNVFLSNDAMIKSEFGKATVEYSGQRPELITIVSYYLETSL